MKLALEASQTIQQVQFAFRTIFSHLKIEFYRSSHLDEIKNIQHDQYLHNVTISEITGHQNSIIVEFSGDMTTSEFEKYFESEFKIYIQIFRLQRGTWLQTTSSDSKTLNQQNEQGIQADMNIEPISPSDIDFIPNGNM